MSETGSTYVCSFLAVSELSRTRQHQRDQNKCGQRNGPHDILMAEQRKGNINHQSR